MKFLMFMKNFTVECVLVTPPTVTDVCPIIQPKPLLVGETLTIAGDLFVDGATVKVVDAKRSPASPPSAGSYAVVVTNPDTGYRAATDGLLTYAAHS
eukprot:gene21628-28634_t